MADAYRLVIQVTKSGVAIESDFVQVADVTGNTPGQAWNQTDASTYPYNQLLGYRARWVCIADSTVFSAWSEVKWVRALPPQVRNNMALTFPIVTAAQTQLAMGVEQTYGQAAQVLYGIDARNIDVSLTAGRANIEANRFTPSPVSDVALALSTTQANFTMYMRPNGACPRIIKAGYTILSTQTIAPAGGVPTYYIHKLIPALTEEQPVTLAYRAGPQVKMFSGGKINTLEFSSDKTATECFQAQVAMMGLNYYLTPGTTQNDLSISGINGVTYDNGKYAPVDWSFWVSGIKNPDCRSVSHSLNRNLVAKEVGNNFSGASLHTADKSPLTLSCNFYWNSQTEMKQYYGVSDQDILLFGQGELIIQKECRWIFDPPTNAQGFKNRIEFVYPICSMSNLPMNAADTGPFMQDPGFQPQQDPATNNVDHYILWTTLESAASWNASQPESGPAPANKLYSYSNDGIQSTSAGATTTVITVDVDPYGYLATTDNAYNGLPLYLTTGTLKGQSRTITGYVASTRTFTVGTPFPSAPATGDKNIVVGGWNK